jgi:hypothetical protein
MEDPMDVRTRRVAATLEAAERAHAAISQKTGGADPEWPLFYSWWLLEWSDLADELATRPTRSQLIFELMTADREYRAGTPNGSWSEVYAERLVATTWTAA